MCKGKLPTFMHAIEACAYISKQIEKVQSTYFSVNQAMPGFIVSDDDRHRLIGEILAMSLKR